MRKIILASSSPRRREILSKLGFPFEVKTSNYKEDMGLPLPPSELAKFLSAGKALSVSNENPGSLVIAADTFVMHQGTLLGKPKTERDAIAMLKMLSGKENDIVTGVTIIDGLSGNKSSFHEITKVFMRDITEQEIHAYVRTGEPLDKAGAYALQELGAIFIQRIEGDFFNAMGLPLARLARELEGFGIKIL